MSTISGPSTKVKKKLESELDDEKDDDVSIKTPLSDSVLAQRMIEKAFSESLEKVNISGDEETVRGIVQSVHNLKSRLISALTKEVSHIRESAVAANASTVIKRTHLSKQQRLWKRQWIQPTKLWMLYLLRWKSCLLNPVIQYRQLDLAQICDHFGAGGG